MHTNAGIHVVTHAYTVQCVFMKARDPEWERERERRLVSLRLTDPQRMKTLFHFSLSSTFFTRCPSLPTASLSFITEASLHRTAPDKTLNTPSSASSNLLPAFTLQQSTESCWFSLSFISEWPFFCFTDEMFCSRVTSRFTDSSEI